MLRKNLREEKFFFWYYYRTKPWDTMRLTADDRKFYLDRFIEQKNKENEELEKVKRKK